MTTIRVKDYSVSLCDGKYIFCQYTDGSAEVFRYGEPWRKLSGDKFVCALADRVHELQAQIPVWLPISTFPEELKDGTPVLLYHVKDSRLPVSASSQEARKISPYEEYSGETIKLEDGPVIGGWCPGVFDDEQPDGNFPDWWFALYNDEPRHPINPTHWMRILTVPCTDPNTRFDVELSEILQDLSGTIPHTDEATKEDTLVLDKVVDLDIFDGNCTITGRNKPKDEYYQQRFPSKSGMSLITDGKAFESVCEIVRNISYGPAFANLDAQNKTLVTDAVRAEVINIICTLADNLPPDANVTCQAMGGVAKYLRTLIPAG